MSKAEHFYLQTSFPHATAAMRQFFRYAFCQTLPMADGERHQRRREGEGQVLLFLQNTDSKYSRDLRKALKNCGLGPVRQGLNETTGTRCNNRVPVVIWPCRKTADL
jgi:hypothetical protein